MTPDKHNGYLMLVPHQLALLYRAFDAVWDEVARDYCGSPSSTEAARLRLANAVFAAYQNGFTEPATLSAYARRRMQMWQHESRLAV